MSNQSREGLCDWQVLLTYPAWIMPSCR